MVQRTTSLRRAKIVTVVGHLDDRGAVGVARPRITTTRDSAADLRGSA